MTKARDLANASTALSAVDATELGYLDGVTSNIQTQFGNISGSKAQPSEPSSPTDGMIWVDTDGSVTDAQYIAKNVVTTTGDIIYASGANTPARLGIGSTSQVLTVSGGVPSWATPSSGTPAFVGAIAWSNTSQALTSGAATVLTFGNEEVDTDGFHSTSSNTGRMTIPTGKDGKYLLTVHARLWNASSFTQIYFYKNGSAISNGIEGGQVWALGTGYIRTTASVVATAVAGDYFEVLGGADGSPTKENARFSIQFLGA